MHARLTDVCVLMCVISGITLYVLKTVENRNIPTLQRCHLPVVVVHGPCCLLHDVLQLYYDVLGV
jgi:hypothetical protein